MGYRCTRAHLEGLGDVAGGGVGVDVEAPAAHLVGADGRDDGHEGARQQLLQQLRVDDGRVAHEPKVQRNRFPGRLVDPCFLHFLRLDEFPVQAAQPNGPFDPGLV
jgi:hypothetical protein